MVDEARLRSTTDAQVWTEEFLTVVPDADPGLMLGWLANAIEAGALREAARYEQVGFRQPGVAHGYEFHSYCSGEPQAPGRSIFYDHSHCVPLYRQVTEGEEG